MMKRNLLCALALSVALVSCETSFSDDSVAFGGSTSEITVEGVGFGADTRMSVTPDASNEVWAVEWEQDDQVAGWFSDGTASAFTMVALEDDANLATFTGTAPSDATMRFVYPCNVDAVGADGSLAIDLSAQTIDMSDPYMTYGDNNLYMLSDAFSVSESETAYPSMRHLMAGMELAVTFTNVDATYVPVKAVITGLNSSATVAFADGAVTGADGTITLTIDNASALVEGETVLFPFSVVPFTTTGSESITIELYFSDGTTASITKSGIASGLEFNAGEHSTMEFDFRLAIELVLEIGALYDDGVDRGIIWWIADDGTSLKITNIAGGNDPLKVFTPVADNLIGIDALDEDDGYVNTQLFLNAENYSATNFPLFAWVAELGEGWYIPSVNEYITMLPMYYTSTAFKTALTTYGDKIYDGTFYWASTLDADNPTSKAWALKYWGSSSKTVTTYGVTNSTGRGARAAKKISLKDYSGYTPISSAADLAKIGVDDAYPLDGSYCLTSNIDLSEYSNWTPIGTYNATVNAPFTGTFDGDNYTITGLTIDAADYCQALFGYVTGATIKDFTISNASVKNTSSYTAIAVAVAEEYSTIENITVDGGTITASGPYTGSILGATEYASVTSCSSSATIASSGLYVGGIVGYDKYSNIASCTMSGSVTVPNSGVGGILGYSYGTTVTSCVNSGAVTVSGGSSKTFAGGIVGYDNTNGTGVITGCSNSGAVTGDTNFTYIGGILGYGLTTSTVTDCSNSGAVTGLSYVGGISGYGASIISSCYNTGDITGLSGGYYTGGIAGCVHNVTKCYNTGTVTSANSYVGGIAGTPCFDDKSFEPMNYVTACYNTGTVSGNAAIGGIMGRTTNAAITITSCFNYSSVTGSSNVAAVLGNLSTTDSFVLSCYFVNYTGSDVGIYTNNNSGETTEVTIAGLNAAVASMNEAAGETYYVAGSSDTTLPSFK